MSFEDFLVRGAMLLFAAGMVNLCRHFVDMYRFKKKYLRKPAIDWDDLLVEASNNGGLPYFAIMVPAREETGVIENTVRRLAQFHYPKDHYEILVITDERETLSYPGENTAAIVERVATELNEKVSREFVKSTTIPAGFDGYYPGHVGGKGNRSTKGRALNWGLRQIPNYVDMVGVYDADARPHPDLLRFVALRRLRENIDVIQGPVYPVSNYASITWVSRFAALHFSWWHKAFYTKLAKEKKKLQFLAGTNYFIDRNLVRRIGGWDYEALTEDAELSLRLYSQEGRFAKWHPYEEIEQSPKDFRAFFRQRRRWAEGYLELVPRIKRAKMQKLEKASVLYRIYTAPPIWVLTELGPLIGPALYLSHMYARTMSSPFLSALGYVLLFASICYLSLYSLIYYELREHVQPRPRRSGQLLEYSKLAILTVPYWLVQALPGMSAMKRRLLGHEERVWEKTARTDERELPTSQQPRKRPVASGRQAGLHKRMRIKYAIVLGTRPEIVKMAPLIKELERQDLDYLVVHSGQHYSPNMDSNIFMDLDLPTPLYNLGVGSASRRTQIRRIRRTLRNLFEREHPDIVLVEGDTNTVLAVAYAARDAGIRVGHVEAGLRSYDRKMPEEINRLLADRVSDYLFAPTLRSKENLLKEGIREDKIHVTGNTIVDATLANLEISNQKSNVARGLIETLNGSGYILLTLHRQSNVDPRKRLRALLQEIAKIPKYGLRRYIEPGTVYLRQRH